VLATLSFLLIASPFLLAPPRDRARPAEPPPSRIVESLVLVPEPAILAIGDPPEGGVAGACPPVVGTWTSSDFGPGSYIAQGGFAEDEVAAVSFTISPDQFPLRLDLCEMIFATSSTQVTTTTHWSIIVWEGTPANGQVIFSASSDGKTLPHLVIPPGTNGVNVQFLVDPGDPDQIVVQNDGTDTFSIGYRIDRHNNQVSNPCFVAPPSNSNAFPCTDVGGLQHPTSNWLFAIDCGAFGCPAGWRNFAQLPTTCRPSGDWVIRATWTPVSCAPVGACCLPGGGCDTRSESECIALGGSFQGAGSTCSVGGCSAQPGPCCFTSTGGCLPLTSATCLAAGGTPGPAGLSCTGYVCFPSGACCLPDGSCAGPVSPGECAALSGVFQGNGTSCAGVNCPDPVAACCFGTGFCLPLSEADCTLAGASWQGIGTSCVDANANGTADACEARVGDLDGDGVVGSADLTILLGAWGGGAGPADLNSDGTVGAADLTILLGNWG
jgi:hypothetical protein